MAQYQASTEVDSLAWSAATPYLATAHKDAELAAHQTNPRISPQLTLFPVMNVCAAAWLGLAWLGLWLSSCQEG